MDLVPITALTPNEAPPTGSAIRAIVTLSWPFSSSTRQCALLLADPDFRLRNRKGQIRVRFTGASAEAVAKAHVGIGDEVLLGLDGSSWEQDPEATRTPGKSVDGELVYRRRLQLKVIRSSAEDEEQIHVDAPVSPPPRSMSQARAIATPLPKAVSALRSSLEGAIEGLPSYTYTSPAFAKRLRLSGESFLDSAYDPFVGGNDDIPRTPFGSGLQWRYAEKTPSPKKDGFKEALESPERPNQISQPTDEAVENMDVDARTSGPAMLPPALPRLSMPEQQLEEENSDQEDGPSTPKLRPVKSPALPLPSPLPVVGGIQIQFGPSSAPPVSQNRELQMPPTSPQEDVQQSPLQERPLRNKPTEAKILREEMTVLDEDHDQMSQSRIETPPDATFVVDDALREQGLDMLDVLADATDEGIALIEGESSGAPDDQIQTPKKDVAQFGLDGAISAPSSAQVTPQSEKEKVMAQTYRSLFGFQKQSDFSPKALQQEALQADPESPTPSAALPASAQSRLVAADIPDAPEDQTMNKSVDIPSTPLPALGLQAPPSSIRPSQAEIIKIGSSSEDESDEDQDDEQLDIPASSAARRVHQRPPPKLEIQDTYTDSEHEDLLQKSDSLADSEASYEEPEDSISQGSSPPAESPELDSSQPPPQVVDQEAMVGSSIPSRKLSLEDRSTPGHSDQIASTAPPKSTAPTTVIDLGSSSPIVPAEPSPTATRSSDNDLVSRFIEPEKFESVEDVQIIQSQGEESHDASGPTEELPDDESLLPFEGETHVQHSPEPLPEPLYPSLPLSPSNSQSLRDMHSQPGVDIILHENVASTLPPTPQLTQGESSIQHKAGLVLEPPTSQEAIAKESSRLEEMTEEHEARPTMKKKPTKKSVSSRLSNVPNVISAWFSPKRSSALATEGEVEHMEKASEEMAMDKTYQSSQMQEVKTTSASGLSTSLSYFTPLSRLDELLNPSSQPAFGANTVDVFAVVTDQTKEPAKAKRGPRDFFTIFHISDANLQASNSVRVEAYRRWEAVLPVAEIGDVVLLRAFAVKSRKHAAYLLSTKESAWCVWRYSVPPPLNDLDKERPVWAQSRLSASSGGAIREEVKGSPIDFGEEERMHAGRLRQWWISLQTNDEATNKHEETDEMTMNGHATEPVAAKL